MKTILSALTIAAASTALAVESSNTFGILRVDSTAAQTIVSVPWENAGGGAIKVKDVVKTANLTVGDKLYYYANGSYKMWLLRDGGWEGAQVQKIESDGSTVTAEAGADSDVLVRGGALILERQDPAKPFYLYGQYQSSSVSTECEAGGLTLLASPLTAATDLNACEWTDVGDDDCIYVPTALMTLQLNRWPVDNKTDLNYSAESSTKVWGVKKSTGKISVKNATVPAGQGVWYQSKGSAKPSVQWR